MNTEIQQYLGHHPRDIGICLGQFVTAGCLYKDGHGRGTRYRLNKPDGNSSHQPPVAINVSSEHLPSSSEHLPPSSEHLPPSSEHLSAAQTQELQRIASVVRQSKKLPKATVEATILLLCENHWLSLRNLAELLDRTSDTLRNHYITPMIKDGRLEARVPEVPNHPTQAYRKKWEAQS